MDHDRKVSDPRATLIPMTTGDTDAPEQTLTATNRQYSPFSYLATPRADLYRRVMLAMMQAKERFTVHVRPEQVLAFVTADGGPSVSADEVTSALDALARPEWGNLLSFPDSSRVTAVEDFYRRRMLYQLSPAGEAAERAIGRYDETIGAPGALQAVALEDIAATLRALLDAVTNPHLDDALVHRLLLTLRDRFDDLAENAVVFMGSVQRSIDLHDADLDAFIAYKDRLIEYLERFIADLVTRGAEIATLLGRFTPADVTLVCEVAAAREVQDAAPGAEPPPVAAHAARWRRRWQGLTDWFVSTPDRESEAKLLRARARSAIPALLQVVSSLNDRTSGRSDRSADFLTLARWFADLPDDGARHRLWRVAFGLTSARHLTVTPQTLEAWAAGVGPSTSWQDAPPLQISPQLRRTGSYERRGRPNRVVDRSSARALLRERARREAEETAAARARLLTDGPQPLSAIGDLDPQAFRLFLALLGDALGALRPGSDEARVQTSDGELEIMVRRVPDAPDAVVHTEDGDLTGPELVLDIRPSYASTP